MTMQELSEKCTKHALVGSRVTCDPAPTDTDQDVLVLCSPEQFGRLIGQLFERGFDIDGSAINDPIDHLNSIDTFQSFSNDDLNLIITQDVAFYRKFMAATFVAKRLNLLNKTDRICLFQAVLYANEIDVREDLPSTVAEE